MKLSHISKTYYNKNNTVKALRDINIEFDSTGLVVILGPSGCGKTTLLNIISGDDTSFEGEKIDTCSLSYLTQDVDLFESMTVFENLLIVNEDRKLIQSYLEKYGLSEHKNKKVKKCSFGQKKRVQFIRSLLQNPGLLLCDEPTAALDHDNSEQLMQDIKEVSKDMLVVLVTHNIALAEKYADRIIHMGKGIIEKDERIHKVSQQLPTKLKDKKNLIQTIRLTAFELKSRILENFIYVIFVLFGTISIFATFSLYFTIEKQTDIKEIYKTGSNLVYSYPIDSTKKEEFDGKYAIDFDFYYYEDILEVVETYPEIIGVEAFYDDDTYLKSIRMTSITHAQMAPATFKTVDYTGYDEENGVSYIKFNIPYDNAFFVNDAYKDKLAEYKRLKNQNRLKYYGFDELTGLYGETFDYPLLNLEEQSTDFGFSFFDLVHDEKIPVLYGTYPTRNNEIIICKNTADLLMSYIGYSSYEEMMNSTITVGVYGRANLLAENTSIDYFYDDETANVRELIDLKITGISSVENDTMRMVFFNNEFAKNAITSHFVENYDDLYFEYVRFIVDPESDVEAFIEKVNKSFNNEKSMFYLGNVGMSSTVSYRDFSNLFIFGMSIMLVYLAGMIIYYVFNRKRILKERRMMKEYNYSRILESITRVFTVHTLTFLLILIFGSSLCDLVNQFAVSMFCEAFLEMDISMIFFSYLLIMIYSFVCEAVIGVKVHDKHQKC